MSEILIAVIVITLLSLVLNTSIDLDTDGVLP